MKILPEESGTMGNCSQEWTGFRHFTELRPNTTTPLNFVWGEAGLVTIEAYVMWGEWPDVNGSLSGENKTTPPQTVVRNLMLNETGRFCLDLDTASLLRDPYSASSAEMLSNGTLGTLAVLATSANGGQRMRCADIQVQGDAEDTSKGTSDLCKRSTQLGAVAPDGVVSKTNGAEMVGAKGAGMLVAGVAVGLALLA
ncbi:hypothetical protein JCM8097_007767 [Rhodosporidiobolus ruineniae]